MNRQEVIELGDMERGDRAMRWKDWFESKKQVGIDGEYPILRVWPPNRYPSATVVALDEDAGVTFKLTLNPHAWGLIQNRFATGRSLRGVLLVLVISGGKGSIAFREASHELYSWDGTGWKYEQ